MFDINLIMEKLKKERVCFSSEADFQFAFAWKTKELYNDCKIILEQFAIIDDNGKYSYIDLVVKYKGNNYPIEFKYLTASLEYLHFKLKKQSARDIRSYDVIKDIKRVETYCNQNKLEKGYVVVITNDSSYWKLYSKANPKTNSYQFNLGEKRILTGELNWNKNTGDGTRKGRESSLNILGKYEINWENYSQINSSNGTFKYFIIETSLNKNIKGSFGIKEQNLLFEYLYNLDSESILLTFEKIEYINKTKLPKSATIYSTYWSDKNRKHALMSWVKAGFLAKLKPNIKAVEFYKYNNDWSDKNINNKAPKHWILSSILEETYGIREVESSILAWIIQEDNRPLYLESLISVIYKDNTWQLVHLYRHPHDKSSYSSEWKESIVYDIPSYVGSILFDHKPTQEELLKFLDNTWWKFTPGPEWYIHDIGIDIQSWKNLTGENPPSKFLKVIDKKMKNNK